MLTFVSPVDVIVCDGMFLISSKVGGKPYHLNIKADKGSLLFQVCLPNFRSSSSSHIARTTTDDTRATEIWCGHYIVHHKTSPLFELGRKQQWRQFNDCPRGRRPASEIPYL
jgi:hypothetical protein